MENFLQLFAHPLLKTLLVYKTSLTTFAMIWFPSRLSRGGMKREIRCKSGAIPVAVKPPNPLKGELGSLILLPLSQDGKAIRLGLSQKTCQINTNIIQCFR